MLRSLRRGILQQLKGFYRNPAFWVIFVFAIVVIIDGFTFYKSRSDFSYTLAGGRQGIEVLLLAMLIWGLQLVRRGQESDVEELYASFRRGRTMLSLSQVLTLLFLAVVISVVMWISHSWICIETGAPFRWLIISAKAIILYAVLPMGTCGVMGMCIGRWIRTRAAYGVAFLLWMVIGSQSDRIFAYILLATGYQLHGIQTFIDLVNFGFPDLTINVLDFVTGYPMEYQRWTIRLVYLIWALILYFSGVFAENRAARSGRKGRNWTVKLTAVAIVPLWVVMYSLFGDFMRHYSASTRAASYLIDCYSTPMDGVGEGNAYTSYLMGNMTFSPDDNMTVISNDVDLQVGASGMKVCSTIRLRADEALEGQMFTLYQGFNVTEVLCNGRTIPYQREKEALWVPFDGGLKAQEQVELQIAYQGKSAPGFPANETTAQLYHRYAWLPYPGMREEGDYTILMPEEQISDPVRYTLRYRGPNGVFCNLEEISPGLYEGISSNGVILYTNMMIYQTKQGKTLYIPAAANNQTPGFLDRYDLLIDYENEMVKAGNKAIAWLTGEEGNSTDADKNIDSICIISDITGSIGENGQTAFFDHQMVYAVMNVTNQDLELQIIEERGVLVPPYTKDIYLEIISRALKPLTKQGSEETGLITLLREYCAYRDEVISYLQLTEDLEDQLMIQMNCTEREIKSLADAIYETPREETDAFFAEWYKEVMAGYSRGYQNLDDITEAMTGVRPVDEKEEPTGMRPEGY